MACELSANALQEVAPGALVIFTEVPVPCERGLVRNRIGTGNILLSGRVHRQSCGCCPKSANYLTSFGANIAIPTGGTVEEISLALVIDGAEIPATSMIVTPAAVEQFFNVSDTSIIQVFRGCCETLGVKNTSNQAIYVQNANIIISRPDLNVTY